jgi:lipoate-protein ligase A
MQVFDYSYPSPEANLAADEALLDLAEAGESGPVLRFWESPVHFVTLGYTNHAEVEANIEACQRHGVPILRRVSGGGTVLQGPGSLNYALIHPIPDGDPMNVSATNCLVMRRNRLALANLLGQPVEIAGHTDLALGSRKFSGNAQRRKRRYFLFHGTLLLDMDLELVQTLLKPPSKEPDYRAGRRHTDFIMNLPTPREAVKAALRTAWEAEGEVQLDLNAAIERLVAEKYSRPDWNFKF